MARMVVGFGFGWLPSRQRRNQNYFSVGKGGGWGQGRNCKNLGKKKLYGTKMQMILHGKKCNFFYPPLLQGAEMVDGVDEHKK